MGARTKRLRLDERWREKIRTSMLINRLERHVEGKVELSPSQVTAALGLLKKTAPDLQATELTGEGGGPLKVVIDDHWASDASS